MPRLSAATGTLDSSRRHVSTASVVRPLRQSTQARLCCTCVSSGFPASAALKAFSANLMLPALYAWDASRRWSAPVIAVSHLGCPGIGFFAAAVSCLRAAGTCPFL
ncbi:hypothetical protein QEG98_24600 [Myxococcus sp. MxC21-1]|uniref:hypothetical protein n=1 Tax=Myxococcus sp. MxC21-1 TaxID=3041439 RepID=UPI002B2C7AA4|nr:hypothetical protein QEG98_24600 [Myxococcus sp. MxC21-1]